MSNKTNNTSQRNSGGQPRILVGTSGFSYKEWRGSFYPEDLPAKKYLSYYGEHFKTTEINNTFYRIPTSKLTEGWYPEVPPDFSFTLKLSQRITHIKRLKDVDEEMKRFFDAASALKEKLGPVLVQLPPNFRKNLEVLEAFLDRFAAGRMLAFEFRHQSWFEEDLYSLLAKHKCALGVVEAEKQDGNDPDEKLIKKVTGSFVYMRLRKGEYSAAETKEWAQWIRAQPVDVYCYLKHDERAPVLAQQLLRELAQP